MSKLADYTSNNLKDNIVSLKFNTYGDKFGAVDASGNLFFWKINKLYYFIFF